MGWSAQSTGMEINDVKNAGYSDSESSGRGGNKDSRLA